MGSSRNPQPSRQTVLLCDERHRFLEGQLSEIKKGLEKLDRAMDKIDNLQMTVMGGLIVALVMFIVTLVFKKP